MNHFFFAIPIPPAAVEPLQLVQSHLPTEQVRMSLVRDFHLTFKFFGELNFIKQTEIQIATRDLMKQIKFQSQELELSLTKVGMFYKGNEPRVIWAGVKMSPKLFEFQYELQAVLEPFGFKIEGHYKPHITLARIRDLQSAIPAKILGELKKLGVKRTSFAVDSLELIHSHLEENKSPRYETIEIFPFGAV